MRNPGQEKMKQGKGLCLTASENDQGNEDG